MLRSRVMKELKKRLKRKKWPVWSLGLVAAIFLISAAVGAASVYLIVSSGKTERVAEAWSPVISADEPGVDATPRERTLHSLSRWNGEVEVVLHRVYLCGEETRMLGRHATSEARDLLISHLDWDAKFDRTGTVVMEEKIDDLSPACRSTSYIGLDEDGNLSLFDGPPRKDNVVRTFFQLDVGLLESSLSKERLHELANGIKVSDKDEYNSVLSTFSDYALERSESVLQPRT
ncbi:BofC C-terminal domain-containing protein [Cohnella faecalis]|uniref:BofC C-terminal domain-containing protein n=1 Tax=Cohnella faecalis TaxID=2315694 RepID=UPI001313F52E|nr:BofC C-terminal domain-containing protein [Cohnella faecalis]